MSDDGEQKILRKELWRSAWILLFVKLESHHRKKLDEVKWMIVTARIPFGTTATQEVIVTPEMTVAHFHAAMPAVYGTPIMILHMENTSGAAIADYLPEGWITVGTVVNVKHLAATPVGATVTVKAMVTEVSGNSITFAVEAHDGKEKIGEGIHTRAAVELSRFMRRVKAKFEKG
jgi:fluoroacetyl-CoA thioesterase